LRDEHCYLGQGYLFARPISEADAEHLLAVQAAAEAPDPLPAIPSIETVR
jgi:hypothetical protein